MEINLYLNPGLSAAVLRLSLQLIFSMFSYVDEPHTSFTVVDFYVWGLLKLRSLISP